MTSPICYLNGTYLPLAEARVPVLDRGFVFGDGVYEVVPAYGQRLFRFEHHMDRLERSLAQVRIANPLPRAAWLRHMRHLVADCAAHTGAPDQFVYLQVTRGVAPRDHVMPSGLEPTVLLWASPLPAATPAQRRDGVACVTADDFRWARGDIKSTSLLGAVLARQLAADRGAVETILFRDGHLTEASASNVWIVQDGALCGPPTGTQVLEGIRVGLLQELCADCGIPYRRRPIAEAEVRAADEVLLSSATKEVLPVTTIDGASVGRGATRGTPGPVYAALYAAYQQAKRTTGV